MSLFDDVKTNLREWYAVTFEKTSEVARVTARGYEKFGISRDIDRQFGELGSLVYSKLVAGETDFLAAAPVAELVQRIETLEAELRVKEQEIDEIRRASSAGVGQTTASGGPAAKVLGDPVLVAGCEESAILVEPQPEPADDVTIEDVSALENGS